MSTYVVIFQIVLKKKFSYKNEVSFLLLFIPVLKPETVCHKTPVIDSRLLHLLSRQWKNSRMSDLFMNYKMRKGKVTQMWNLCLPEAPDDCFTQASHKHIAIRARTGA